MIGNKYRDMLYKRLELKPNELVCPREKSEMTPCVARDGDSALLDDGKCVGCLADIQSLIDAEEEKVAAIEGGVNDNG